MDRLLARLPAIETLLWILASLAAFAALILLAPAFLAPPAAAVTPAAAQVAVTARPTLTPVPSSTPLPVAPTYRPRPSAPLPSLPAGAQVYTFMADPTQSGWIATGDDKVHWGDRNLHAGLFKQQVYRSVLFFDITQIPPGSRILSAQIELTGLSRDNLGASGEWRLRLLDEGALRNWATQTPAGLGAAVSPADIGLTLRPEDLTFAQVNQFTFASSQLPLLEARINSTGLAAFRLDGPTDASDSLFTWDGAGLDLKTGAHPVLRVAAVPGKFIVITNTPTPQNVVTAAAQFQTLTAYQAKYGTPTPFPRNYATATPVIYVTAQPTPANVETRIALARYATAVAQTTGTFTPTPPNWIVITPVPPTWTPGPTWTPVAVPISQLTPITTGTPVPPAAVLIKTPIPDKYGGFPLIGNILFLSDRYGGSGPLLMKPGGQVLTQLTGMPLYYLAAARERYNPARTQFLDYRTDANGIQQIVVEDLSGGWVSQITSYTKGLAYDAAWSPDGSRIAFVSSENGNTEIYVYDLGTRATTRLTFSPDIFTYNQRPSWSPDGTGIVFKSNRETGHFQIWVMNANGSGLQNLSNSPYEDVDPVWVKGP